MTIREIENALEEGQSLKQIAQAYSEIANQKMKRIRAASERNRIFLKEISSIYTFVRNLALKKGLAMAKPKARISLVLTSNYRFYGQVNSDLLQFFISSIAKMQTDIVVIGKVGQEFFHTSKQFKSIPSIILKTDQPDALELKGLVDIIKDYNQVLVFHSSLKTILMQQPTVSQISAAAQNFTKNEKEKFKFIFEPELPKVVNFFDSQILTLLLEGTFLESEVSRTASRFVSMDQAEIEANKFIKEYGKLRSYAKRNLDNNTILENFASMAAVRREV